MRLVQQHKPRKRTGCSAAARRIEPGALDAYNGGAVRATFGSRVGERIRTDQRTVDGGRGSGGPRTDGDDARTIVVPGRSGDRRGDDRLGAGAHDPATTLRLFVWLLLPFAVSCAAQTKVATPVTTPSPSPTPQASSAGGVVAMGQTVRTSAGSLVTVYSWRAGSNRNVPPGPGGAYETTDVGFCSGPGIQESAADLVPLFSVELPDGSRIAPDNLSAPGELRTLGTIPPGQCKRGPLVFQVEGGTKPSFVGYDTSPMTKWRVP